MAAVPSTSHDGHDERVELRKEAATTALYVAICLLAALSAVAGHGGGQADVLAIVWGTTIGLAVAHWFAFRVSARLVASGSVRRSDALAAGAQLAGAAAIALLVTAPVVVAPHSAELDIARIGLAVIIGLVGYEVARTAGAGRGRSLAYGASILVVACGIALVKNLLAGH